MKVSDLKYERVTEEAIKETAEELISRVKNAKSVKEILEARDRFVEFEKEFVTAASLSYMRYTINTIDKFYMEKKD
jgi:hypothetical protein